MESASAHRKIELQSPEDFSYLISNVRRAAADNINAAFPPVQGADGQEDELRVRIEELVDDYITQTFTLAAPNLSINGLPISSPSAFLSQARNSNSAKAPDAQEQYEPFDSRKRQRVEDLTREEEDLLREIAALKRRVPGAAAAAYTEAFRAGVKADEEAATDAVLSWREGVAPVEGGGGGKMLAGLAPLERQGAVVESFRVVVGTLERLKKDMPATVARMERARVAGEYVVTER